jgi:hypothetical protein
MKKIVSKFANQTQQDWIHPIQSVNHPDNLFYRFWKSATRDQELSGSNFSELEKVGVLAVAEREGGLQIRLEVLNLLDDGDQSSINRLLQSLELLGELLLGLSILLEESFLRLLCLGGLGLLEKNIVNLGDINLAHVNIGGGGDDVGLVDAAEGNSVDLVGT